MLVVKVILSLVIGYLLGSIPTAYIFGRLLKGIDIREHGSGNVGATNTFRILGKWPGIAVLFLDILKGVWATVLVTGFFELEHNLAYIFVGAAAVIGHNWTVFLNFKGGKGIATSLGVLIGLTLKISSIQPVLLIALLIWAVVFLFSGYISLASITAATALPIVMVFTMQTLEITLLGVVLCLFVVYRHRPNIERLLSGKESKVNTPFTRKKQ